MNSPQPLHYTISGKGPCIVLLHGLMEDIHIWDNLTPQLSEYFSVLCIDLPGHGESPVYADVHTMDFMAECVNEILIQNKIENCVMAGHSMGGYVMTAFARQFPEKLKGICYCNSHALPDSDETKQNRDRTIALIQSNKQSYIADFIPNLFTETNRIKHNDAISSMVTRAKKMNPKAIIAAQYGIKERSSGLSVLMQAPFPVLFIVGKQDKTVPVDKIVAQALLPQHVEVMILGNVAHVAMIEAHQETADMIESFADRCFCY